MSATSRTHKPGTVVRFAIACLALLGIGAALTSAAWTDNVFFKADATAGSFNLQGSDAEAGPFDEYETEGGALVIPVPTSGFGNLVPGDEPITLDVYVKNAGTVDANLTVTATGSGDLFGAGTTVTVSADAADVLLVPDAVTAVTISLTPGDMPDALQGTTGTVLVTVTGSTE